MKNMVESEINKGNMVLDTYIGNCHVQFCGNYILKDKEEVEKQLKVIEQIIWDGLPKI